MKSTSVRLSGTHLNVKSEKCQNATKRENKVQMMESFS